MTSTNPAVEIEILAHRIETIDRLTRDATTRLSRMRADSEAAASTRALINDLAMDRRDAEAKLTRLRDGLEHAGWRQGKRPIRQLDERDRQRQQRLEAAVRACESARQGQAERFEREGDHHQARIWYREVQGARAHVMNEFGVGVAA